MYPLSMSLVDGVGYACANDEAEHKTLTAAGYGPAFVEQVAQAPQEAPQEVAPRKPGRPKKAAE